MRGKLAGAAVLVGVALTGCGGSGDADGTSAQLSEVEANLQFVRCMRGAGIDVPDPKPGEQPDFGLGSGAGDPAKLQAALQECDTLVPGVHGGATGPGGVEQIRKLARCIRENGVPDFPDPGPDGQIPFDRIDHNNAKLVAARDKCQQFFPGGGG